jgi:hypothetical protein
VALTPPASRDAFNSRTEYYAAVHVRCGPPGAFVPSTSSISLHRLAPSGRLLDSDYHRFGPYEVVDVAFAKANLLHPGTAIGARVLESSPGGIDQHVEA